MIDRQFITTADGSTTIFLPEWDESYHSKHGAIQEAYHVFIKNGLDYFSKKDLSILEMGFGTGLNALITLFEAEKRSLKVEYDGVEAFPISREDVLKLNYIERLDAKAHLSEFEKMHSNSENQLSQLTESFSFRKIVSTFETLVFSKKYDLIYFDAFGFRVQPELWSEEIFQKLYDSLSPGGVLVTYAARSVIKRNMQAAGFTVEKLPGAPGKREMFRALK